MTDGEIPPEVLELRTQFERVFGEIIGKQPLFLPFNSLQESVDFLRTVPDGAGREGVMIALDERSQSKPSVESPQIDVRES